MVYSISCTSKKKGVQQQLKSSKLVFEKQILRKISFRKGRGYSNFNWHADDFLNSCKVVFNYFFFVIPGLQLVLDKQKTKLLIFCVILKTNNKFITLTIKNVYSKTCILIKLTMVTITDAKLTQYKATA